MQQSLVKEKGMLRLNGITSGQILSLLQKRHTKDAIVPECKNGETWGARDLLKLDAWVLMRTYSPLTTIGYEIKCSRHDFEEDQKWTNYLDLCHQFYFVCPAGLIRATDLPNQIGIIWASKDKLHTKRKAGRIKPDIEKLNRLLIYVVMSRSQIVDNMYHVNDQKPKSHLQLVKEATEIANEKRELAYFVTGHIRDIVTETHKAGQELEYREDRIERFEEQLKLLGITWDSQNGNWSDTLRVEDEINILKKRIDNRALGKMKQLASQLNETVETITKLREDGKIGDGL